MLAEGGRARWPAAPSPVSTEEVTGSGRDTNVVAGTCGYGNDMKEYGFYRHFEIDSAGCIRKIGPETRYTIQS